MRRRFPFLTVVLLCAVSVLAHATPEEYLLAASGVEGIDTSGATVAWNTAQLSGSERGIVAVGVPDATGGKGRVTLYDALNTEVELQELSLPSGIAVAQFGATVLFISDISGDGADELLVGAPGGEGVADGGLYAYTSSRSGDVVQYSLCGGAQGEVGFGTYVQVVRGEGGVGIVNVVVADPYTDRNDSFIVSSSSIGVCEFTPTTIVPVTPRATPFTIPPATLLATPTPFVTPRWEGQVGTPISEGDQSGWSPTDATPTVAYEVLAPVVVAPGSGGLPAPRLAAVGQALEVTMPVVRPQFSEAQRATLARFVQQKRGVSRQRALQLLRDSANLVVTYIVSYEEVAAARRFAFIQSAHAQDSVSRDAKVRQIRSRLNTITLRKVRLGAIYRVSYRVEISTKAPRQVLGTTQSSPAVTMRIG